MSRHNSTRDLRGRGDNNSAHNHEVRGKQIGAAPSILYVAYPKAMKSLADRLGATPEELAAWIFIGPENGGLAAYLNANEFKHPPRFRFGVGNDSDYITPLMACSFKEDDIVRFEPTERFITGRVLIERWSKIVEIRPEAFILAKIAESRLLDAHPTFGCTQGSMPEDADFPPLSEGLFVLSHVEEIEAEEFGDETALQVATAKPKEHLNHDIEWQKRANEIAATKQKETGRPITRNKVAKYLANELNIKEETVLRRIRKQW